MRIRADPDPQHWGQEIIYLKIMPSAYYSLEIMISCLLEEQIFHILGAMSSDTMWLGLQLTGVWKIMYRLYL